LLFNRPSVCGLMCTLTTTTITTTVLLQYGADILAMRVDFCMKVHTTVKQENIHIITKLC